MRHHLVPLLTGACLAVTACGAPSATPSTAPSSLDSATAPSVPAADGTCAVSTDGTSLKVPTALELWPTSRSQAWGSNTLRADSTRSGCDVSNTEPVCDAGLPWSGLSAESLEPTFARLRPTRMVAGVVGGGAPPITAGGYDAQHDLRYVVVDFEKPVDRSMRWYADALRCGKPATFDGSAEGLLFTARSSKNEANGVGPVRVPARLVVRGSRAIYLEFSGTPWSVADMDKATRLFLLVGDGEGATSAI